MRGIRIFHLPVRNLPRITPAHAGNTKFEFGDGTGDKDHPRTCGEYHKLSIQQLAPLGSPPHMRGIRYGEAQGSGLYRITPAHAGNTLVVSRFLNLTWDHPRTCGEY